MGQLGENHHRMSVPGVLEAQRPGVEALTALPKLRLFAAVNRVPQNGVANVGHVYPDLVGAAGFQLAADVGIALIAAHHLPMGDGVPSAPLGDAHFFPVRGVPPDGRVHGAAVFLHNAADNGLIGSGHGVVFQLMTVAGADAVAFYMSANAGEALKPMSKVASGGELARIMLAMKNVLVEKDQVETLIFDEVDTGVSGRAAQKVAQKLKSVAAHKQVLCVTHLPQLAALADNHLLIAKQERNGRTYTSVTPLDLEGRKRELARIIGGATITETTLKSAEEMLRG